MAIYDDYTKDVEYALFLKRFNKILYNEFKRFKTNNPGKDIFLKIIMIERKMKEKKQIVMVEMPKYILGKAEKSRALYTNSLKKKNRGSMSDDDEKEMNRRDEENKRRRKIEEDRMRSMKENNIFCFDSTHAFRSCPLPTDHEFKLLSSTRYTQQEMYEVEPILVEDLFSYEISNDSREMECQTENKDIDLVDSTCQTMISYPNYTGIVSSKKIRRNRPRKERKMEILASGQIVDIKPLSQEVNQVETKDTSSEDDEMDGSLLLEENIAILSKIQDTPDLFFSMASKYSSDASDIDLDMIINADEYEPMDDYD
jgi:hypothetical protein